MIRSLRWRVVFFFVLILGVTLGALGWYLSHSIRQQDEERTQEYLLSHAHLLSGQAGTMLSAGEPYDGLAELARLTSINLGYRVTIILPDGTVAAESDLSPEGMENHLNRPEVQEALLGLDSSEVRYSRTLKEDMLYVAVPIYQDDSVIGVTRLAVSLSDITEKILQIEHSLMTAFVLAALAATITAIFLSRIPIHPLSKLANAIENLGEGELPAHPLAGNLGEVDRLERAFYQMSLKANLKIDELKSEQAKLDAVLNNMTDGILIIDEEGIVQLINPAGCEIFNIPIDQAIGHSLAEVARHHQVIELWKKTLESNTQQLITFETSPDRMFLQGIANPLGSAMQGNTLLVFQDLTRLHRLEMVRRDFVSNVSHELRTPIASLKAVAETLLDGGLEDLPNARRFLERMDGEVDNLTQMVNELLELSRIESGRVPLERKPVKARNLLCWAAERMQLQAGRARIQLAVNEPNDLPEVLADAERIQQVLVNLIHNAIKFTPPGGRILLSGKVEGEMVVFSVQDTGVGIASADLERIFERFYKADRARSGGGTGLGLSIARHLVESHCGKIWAESTPGEGSVFYFSLPIDRKS